MIRYFHLLVEFHVHQTIQLYVGNKQARPFLLLLNSIKLRFLFKVEAEVFGTVTKELDLQRVGRLYVQPILESHENCLVNWLLHQILLPDRLVGVGVVEKCFIKDHFHVNIRIARIDKCRQGKRPNCILTCVGALGNILNSQLLFEKWRFFP